MRDQILSVGGQVVDRQRLDDSCWAVAWSRDGSKLLVSAHIRPEEPAHVWVMDAVAGDPVRTVVPTDSINTLSLRRGDRDLVFSAGNPAPEFWILRGIDVPVSAAASAPSAAPAPFAAQRRD